MKDYTETKERITEYITANLKEKRLKHVFGVRDTALNLCRLYGGDMEKAELCALFHDMYKYLSVDQVNYYVNLYNLDEKYLNNPNLAHSKLAAVAMRRDYGIEDEDMLNAVAYHTTGRACMSVLEKIIALSDFIEPNRSFPEVYRTRELAEEDLDRACLYMYEKTIEFLNYRIANGEDITIDNDTIEAKEYLWKTLNMQK
ncbi:MAG: bis(5'-nucleosyl)-tetraphosphatase (symmetrical) YqeK [Clostridia bacterium]|nr:bis(5'-nucleosyl)-tetraphosphatase (symmetrical) YqeK [Clostridia bacterium]